MIELVEQSHEYDKEGGNHYENSIYKFIDKEGKIMHFKVQWFDSGTIQTYCAYSDYIYAYTGSLLTF